MMKGAITAGGIGGALAIGIVLSGGQGSSENAADEAAAGGAAVCNSGGTATAINASQKKPGGIGKWNSDQVKNATLIATVAADGGMGEQGAAIGIAVAMQESTLNNLQHGHLDSLGLFQQRPSMGWGTAAQVQDPVFSTQSFFGINPAVKKKGLKQITGWQNMPLTEASQRVQASGLPTAYAKWEDDARALARQVLGKSGKAATAAMTSAAPAQAKQASDACPSASSSAGDVKALQDTVRKYAWPDWQPDSQRGLEATTGYQAAIAAAKKADRFWGKDTPGRPDGIHCSAFASRVIHDSGWDKGFNYGDVRAQGAGFIGEQLRWMKSNWELVGKGSELKESDLKPGDVGVSLGGGLDHTWLYVGKMSGFNGTYAEASYRYGDSQGFAPQARKGAAATVLYAKYPNTAYYRKKNQPAAQNASVSANGAYANPLQGQSYRNSSAYGNRFHPVRKVWALHDGQDMAIGSGAPIYSGCSGKVTMVNPRYGTGGNATKIDCSGGGGISMRYLHQSKFGVAMGQQVKAGQVIGYVGNTGVGTGAHLHFTVLVNGQPTEPVKWMASQGVKI